MKTFEDYQKEMCPYYKNNDSFLKGTTEICYIPENAESLDDAFTYLDLMGLVEEWKKDNEDYFIEHQTTSEALLTHMFESLSWEFPSTFLNNLLI